MRTKLHAMGAILLAMFLVACGTDDPQILDAEGENARAEGGPGGNHALYLEVVGGTPLSAEAASSLPIAVVLRESTMRRAVPTEAVGFTLVQSPDLQTSLSAASSITNDAGEATIDLRLGMLSGEAVVRASHPNAGDLDIVVNVGEASSGTVRVDVRDPANSPVELAPYRVAFFEASELDCASYAPRGRKPEEVTAIHVPDLAQPVVQGGIPSNETFTVVGEALGSGGFTLAGGCVDGVRVNPAETKAIDVQLELVPVSPSGTHTVQSTWDVSEAIASQNSATGALINVVEFMADPGQSIYDIVIDSIEDVVGFGIDLLLDIAGIEDRIVDFINGELFRVAGAETFVAVAADLDTMLNELRVTSRLTIEKTDEDFAFQGREEWTSVAVSWSWQCAESNDPDCGTHVIDLTEDGSQAGAVSYVWTGRVDGYDDLVVESHQAEIDIGRLQIYLFEQVILPELTNGRAHSVGEALAFWIDCGKLAREALQGSEICDPTGFFCLGADEAEFACETGLDYFAEQVMAPLLEQSSALHIDLDGNAKLVDTDSNGNVDEMIDGYTEGRLSGSTEPVAVQWASMLATE